MIPFDPPLPKKTSENLWFSFFNGIKSDDLEENYQY